MTHQEHAEKVWEEIELRTDVTRRVGRDIIIAIIAAALEKQRKADRTAAAEAIATWAANQAMKVKQRSLAEVVMDAILNAEVDAQ